MLKEILLYAVRNECSDIHIVSGEIPIVRHDGNIVRIKNAQVFSEERIRNEIDSLLNEEQKTKFANDHEVDFAFEIEKEVRFRANAFETQNGPAIAIRPILNQNKTLENIDAPAVIKSLLKKRRGLILVSGPTGSGKSTTLAAMIDYINENYACNIITIEDPIEYLHKSKKSLISQREIGTHSNSFASALKNSLRENPDIILVGEMRDPETFALALTAAETGHLVLATLHTSSASNAINRIIDSFSPAEKEIARSMLSNSLAAVILQRLINEDNTKEKRRRAVYEVLVANSSVRNLIKENKIAQINSMIEIGSKFGMTTMKDSILKLEKEGVLSKEYANNLIEAYT